MKKILFTLAILMATSLLTISSSALAHTESSGDMPMMDTQDHEEVVVSQEEFNEVEDIMLKMMNGQQLDQSEFQEMYSFMQSHHGGGWPMMMGYGGMYNSFGRSHMYDGFGGIGMNWLYLLTILVWFGVGVLLLLVLIRRLNNNPSKHEE